MSLDVPYNIGFYFFVAINVASFLIYGLDKLKAKKHSRRIPEKDLLLIAFFAPAGAWAGMQLFRHKTRKPRFRYLVPLFLGIHVCFFYFLVV
jgi:uncharacterized membrane protein YsdA (DUF1294 family)